MADATTILGVLDGFAEGFEFPGFNNMNYDTVEGRLHGYRDGERWALVIEELADWPGGDGPTTIVFAMGDIAGKSLHTLVPLDLSFDDDSGEVILGDTVTLRGEPVKIDAAAIDALCEQHDIDRAFALLVHLRDAHRDALYATEAELAERVAPGLERIISLDEWAHPDVYGGPKPSASEAFQQLAEALASGDISKYAPSEPPNTRDWQHWLASK